MSKLIKYKKIGGGSMRLADGRKIKPNEIFEATENSIPAFFRDLVEKVKKAEPVPQEIDEVEDVDVSKKGKFKRKNSTISVTYSVLPVENTDTDDDSILGYNVVDGIGTVINEELLSEKEATELCVSLTNNQ